jgi:hypothetical protein
MIGGSGFNPDIFKGLDLGSLSNGAMINIFGVNPNLTGNDNLTSIGAGTGGVGNSMSGYLGSTSPIGGIFGSDGLPTFDPSSIRSNPILSSMYDSGFFNQQINASVANTLSNPNALQAIVNEYLKFTGQPVNTSDVTQNGNVIGTINQDIINNALKNLPITGGNGVNVVGSGSGQVTQGGGQTQTGTQQTGGTDPTNRPTTTGTNTGTVGDGSGQVPPPPNTNTGGRNGGGFNIFDIFNVLGGGSGSGATPPFNPNGGDMTYDDLANLPIFGNGGGQGGSATATGGSNFISDLFGDIVGGSLSNVLGDIGNTVINAGVSNYAADQQRDANRDALDFYGGIYQGQIDRLEPFRQAGLGGIPGLTNAANTNPQYRDLFAGQQNINPNTNVQRSFQGQPMQAGSRGLNNLDPSLSYDRPNMTSTAGLPALQAGNRGVNLGDASAVGVNQFNPFDGNDPALQYVMDQGTRAIEGSAAARGKLNSGGTLEALQEMGQGAALNRARDIQSISSSQDQARLASQGQSFGQQTTNAGLNNQLNQQDLANSSGIRSQLFGEGTTQFGQGMGLAGLDLGAQGQAFGQGLGANQFTNQLNQQDLANSMGINSQLFSQDLQGSAFDLGQQQNNIANQFGLNSQLFGQNLGANQFGLANDQNQYNQLFDLTRLGQNSAANQGAGGASFGQAGANILSGNGQIGAANTIGQGQNIGNFLAGLFG